MHCLVYTPTLYTSDVQHRTLSIPSPYLVLDASDEHPSSEQHLQEQPTVPEQHLMPEQHMVPSQYLTSSGIPADAAASQMDGGMGRTGTEAEPGPKGALEALQDMSSEAGQGLKGVTPFDGEERGHGQKRGRGRSVLPYILLCGFNRG